MQKIMLRSKKSKSKYISDFLTRSVNQGQSAAVCCTLLYTKETYKGEFVMSSDATYHFTIRRRAKVMITFTSYCVTAALFSTDVEDRDMNLKVVCENHLGSSVETTI